MLLDLNPIMVEIGPFAIRWYGFLMAISMAVGLYVLIVGGRRQGIPEEDLYNLGLVVIMVGVIGARFIYVATNWSYFTANPGEIIRVDHGGLSFHGAVLGGLLAGWWYTTRKGIPFGRAADLSVPGVAVGIALVRIGNLINGEAIGYTTTVLPFERHPAQLYGSAIGIMLLIIHRSIARRRPTPPPGYLFWSFVLYYQILRGVFEETFRANPLYAWGYINDEWGFGFFTLTHLITPAVVLLAIWLRRRTMTRRN